MQASKRRILCVEDHVETCELIASILDGFEVIGVYSKAEGLRAATEGGFDLHLLDYHLPDGTGLELAILIRAIDQNTPIFFCTNHTDLSDEQITTAGAQRLIKKGPDFVENLVKAVAEILPAES